MKEYDGISTYKDVLVTYKIDGINVTFKDGVALSRANKQLYNFEEVLSDQLHGATFEVFRDNWETTVSLVKTRKSDNKVQQEDLYQLSPTIDPRLVVGKEEVFTPVTAAKYLDKALEEGYEGIVIHFNGVRGAECLKIKPAQTFDLKVLSIKEGNGKNSKKLGSAETSMGWVGTGYTDDERVEFFESAEFIGSTIECECMGVTPGGKMRHPRFLRRRFDK